MASDEKAIAYAFFSCNVIKKCFSHSNLLNTTVYRLPDGIFIIVIVIIIVVFLTHLIPFHFQKLFIFNNNKNIDGEKITTSTVLQYINICNIQHILEVYDEE